MWLLYLVGGIVALVVLGAVFMFASFLISVAGVCVYSLLEPLEPVFERIGRVVRTQRSRLRARRSLGSR